MLTFSLGFSPCPNDTYIFDALLHHLEHPYQYKMVLADVEELNQKAKQTILDITKLSIYGFFQVSNHYQLLETGAALGKGCGPLVLSRGATLPKQGKVALPGKNTTANLLFNLVAKQQNLDYTPVYMPFDQIMKAVNEKTVDIGVIIHESRFTYQKQGLQCVLDLGDWWEEETNLPLPLGCIAAKKEIGIDAIKYTSQAIRLSIEYARQHKEAALPFIAKQAQEISKDVQQQHIDLYVNEYSHTLGSTGRQAIQEMYNRALNSGLLPDSLKEQTNLFATL